MSAVRTSDQRIPASQAVDLYRHERDARQPGGPRAEAQAAVVGARLDQAPMGMDGGGYADSRRERLAGTNGGGFVVRSAPRCE